MRWEQNRHRDVYASGNWHRARKLALERTGGLCIRCGKAATEVDHRVSLNDGGAPFEQANLDPLCHPCHSRKGQEDRGSQAWRMAGCQITLIYGPPGAELLAKVRELARDPSDFVCDSDLIARRLFVDVEYSALLGREDALIVQGERNRLLTGLRNGKTPHRSARGFITSSSPRATAFLPFHVDVEVDPGVSEMLNRVDAGQLPEVFRDLILAYYDARALQAEGLRRSQRTEPSREVT